MTVQYKETLIFYGKEFPMYSIPDMPDNHPCIEEKKFEDFIENGYRLDEGFSFIFSTACWRGYVGVWEVVNNRLYLKEIEGCYKIVCDEPIFADWFTGDLEVILCYQHDLNRKDEELILNLEIEKGIIQRSYVT